MNSVESIDQDVISVQRQCFERGVVTASIA